MADAALTPRALLIDDDATSTRRMMEALIAHRICASVHAPAHAPLRSDDNFDVVIADVATLRRSGAGLPDNVTMPVILLASPGADEQFVSDLGGGEMVFWKDALDPSAVARAVLNAAEVALLRKRTASAEALLGAFLEQAFDLVMRLDSPGTLAFVNQAVAGATGFSREELTGKTLSDFVHPDDLEPVHRMLTRFDRGADGPLVFRVSHADGSWRTLEAAAPRLTGTQPRQLVLVARDVTEVEAARAAFEEQGERLRQAQKMEAIGRLAGGIAHDFANLLTVILGASAHLLEALPEDMRLRADAESIRMSAERAAGMTRQLLAFARHRKRTTGPVDVNALVRGMEPLLRRVIGEDVTLEIACDAPVARVTADPVEVEQAILNLVVNGRDAMPDGGRLTIATRCADHAPVDVETPASNGYVVVLVSDAGTGMDPETRARALDPFFTTKEPGRGTGIGLATVADLVGQSGGWVDIDSTLGEGTTVSIGLPLAAGVPVATLKPAAAGPLPSGSETVLLVEDEDGVRELVRDMLELAGYRVLHAGLPVDAERLCANFDGTIDLLVTDVVMPGMSGLELADRVTSMRPTTRVLFMSGYSEPTTRDGGGRAPGMYYVPKPFDRPTLLRRVRQAIDRSPMEAS